MEYRIERRAYLGSDSIVSSLGFGTKENISAIERYETRLAEWNDGTPVALIDPVWMSLKVSALERYTKLEQLSLLVLGDVLQSASRSVAEVGRSLLLLSTTKGNIDQIYDADLRDMSRTAGRIAAYFGIRDTRVVSNACISGVSAIVIGARMIECGRYDDVFIVGADIATDFVVSGFNAFKSVSPRMCRPFDASRDGLTLGEACGALHLTTEKHDVEVVGGGISNDANHISAPSRTGDGLHFAIERALRQARADRSELAFVNVHGTGTLYNDEMESRALALSSLAEVPCNSLKPYFGHTLGASGVIESIVCAHCLCSGAVYGIKGFERLGVSHNLNISSEHRDVSGIACLKTASGFGGSNAAVVFRKSNEDQPKLMHAREDFRIEEISHASFSSGDKEAAAASFAERIRAEFKKLNQLDKKFYKMDNLSKLGYVVAGKAFNGVSVPADPEKIAIIIANRNSSLDSDIRHQAIIGSELEAGASPAVFVYTLANIVAGEIAIRHKIQGECTFFIEKNKNLTFVSDYARLLLRNGLADMVLCGWCDLLGDEYDAEMSVLVKR